MEWALEIPWSAITVTCLFMLMDIVTGVAQAIKNKDMSSKVMRNGLWHKGGFMLAIVFSILCMAGMAHMELPFELPVCELFCIYIVGCECVSIAENIARINPDTVAFLKKYFNGNTPEDEEKFMPDERKAE